MRLGGHLGTVAGPSRSNTALCAHRGVPTRPRRRRFSVVPAPLDGRADDLLCRLTKSLSSGHLGTALRSFVRSGSGLVVPVSPMRIGATVVAPWALKRANDEDNEEYCDNNEQASHH